MIPWMRLRLLRSLVVLAAAAAVGALPAAAQEARDLMTITATSDAPVPPGGRTTLVVRVEVAEGWHHYGPGDAYDQQTVVAVTGGTDGLVPDGLVVGEFIPDVEPHKHVYEYDPDNPRMEFAGPVTYTATVAIPVDAAAGTLTLSGTVTPNICNDMGCLPPEDLPWSVTLTIAGEPVDPAATGDVGATDPPAGGGEGTSAGTPVPATPEDGGGITLAFLIAAIVGGLLTIATPCVFPMLPLTVSILTKQADKEPGKVKVNALIYAAGMFFSLAGIGLALSLVFEVAPTDLALSPGFNLVIFAFLMVLALSLFGMYDLRLPSFLTGFAEGKAGKGSAMGLFFMGMTLAFTSFSCAAPFAGFLLIEARTSLLKGVVGMSVYAATFSIPFFVLAMFPGMLKKLPQSGGWLNAVKVVMGFVEVAAAFKFLRTADMTLGWGFFSFEIVLALWVACALGAAVYLLGFITLPHDTPVERIGVLRLLWALFFLASAFFLLPGLFGRRIPATLESFIIRTDDGDEVASAGGEAAALSWIKHDLDDGLARAELQGQPLFIDFTGHG